MTPEDDKIQRATPATDIADFAPEGGNDQSLREGTTKSRGFEEQNGKAERASFGARGFIEPSIQSKDCSRP